MNTSIEIALHEARKAREHAYAPYSKFKVGAAVKVQHSSHIIAGCNVENVSYGLSICAERNAIASAVTQLGTIDIEFMVIVTDQTPPAVPCAACLQVISEFSHPHTTLYLCSLSGLQETLSLGDLLPRPFLSFQSKKE